MCDNSAPPPDLATPSGALEILAPYMTHVHILRLFRHFFPTEFAQADLRDPPADRVYSPAEWQFFQLVEERLFPLSLPSLDMQDEDQEVADLVPIWPQNYDWWNWDDASPGWTALLILTRRTDAVSGECDMRGIPPAIQEAAQVQPLLAALNAACTPRQDPLAGLPLVLRALDHATGSLWLDSTIEGGIEAEWAVEDFDILSEHYRIAETIHAAANRLIEWLEADTWHMEMLAALWINCTAPDAPLQYANTPAAIQLRLPFEWEMPVQEGVAV